MEHSFHGRSMGALSVTGNAHYREAFEPGIGNVRFAVYNDIDSGEINIFELIDLLKEKQLEWCKFEFFSVIFPEKNKKNPNKK